MSPAVLTETVWGMAHEKPALIPDRVVVLTSTRGRVEIARDLFTPSPDSGGACVWDALRTALQAEGHDTHGRLGFGTTGNDIRVFTAHDPATGRSRELDDIRTPEENLAVADFVLEEVRRIVENPDTRLIASIAGGRKTMGALLYACLTLIGRETDRLTHVLVNEPFDDPRLKPKFYFPGQRANELTAADNHVVDARSAKIDLADVLFVPLRNLFRKELRRMPGRFSSLVESCRERVRQVAAEEIRLSVFISRPEISVNGQPLRLSPAEYVIVRFLAEHAQGRNPAIDGYKAAIDFVQKMADAVRNEATRNDSTDWRHNAATQGSFACIDDRWIVKNLSSVRDKLRDAGGPAAALVALLPERGRFSLDLPAKNIRTV